MREGIKGSVLCEEDVERQRMTPREIDALDGTGRKHIVLFSGGVGSWWAADRVIKKHGKNDIVLLFTDTKMEDEDLYRFLNDSEDYFGIKITRIADGRTPWQVFKDRKFLGNSRVDPCSEELKRKLADKWIRDLFTPEECVCYVGIDWTEEHRLIRLRPHKLPYKYEAPLCEEPFLDKRQMIAALPIRAPRLYTMGFAHNNCGGFCVKAGKGHFKLLLEKMPSRYLFHEQMEKQFSPHTIIKGLSLEDFRKKIQRQVVFDWEDEIDIGGCGCMIDEPNHEVDE